MDGPRSTRQSRATSSATLTPLTRFLAPPAVVFSAVNPPGHFSESRSDQPLDNAQRRLKSILNDSIILIESLQPLHHLSRLHVRICFPAPAQRPFIVLDKFLALAQFGRGFREDSDGVGLLELDVSGWNGRSRDVSGSDDEDLALFRRRCARNLHPIWRGTVGSKLQSLTGCDLAHGVGGRVVI